MKKYISILFISFYSFALCQDVYPNFSTPKKQLQFERKRIYIKEVSDKKMLIEGQSKELITLTLFNDYFTDSLKKVTFTQQSRMIQYQYKYNIEITQDNRILNEFDFIQAVGLDDEIDSILASILTPYKKQSLQYVQQLAQYNKELKKYQEIAPFENKLKDSEKLNPILLPATVGISVILFFSNKNEFSIGEILAGTLTIFSWFVILDQILYGGVDGNPNKSHIIVRSNRSKLPKPPNYVIKQTLSYNQITAIAESYNRQQYQYIQYSP